MMAVVLTAEYRWECPNCPDTLVTADARLPLHACSGLRGLSAPFVAAGTRCKVEAVERGDWVRSEMVQTDGEGRPFMSVVTTRDDGQDCTVLAPCATARST